jgi:hypothetical protein
VVFHSETVDTCEPLIAEILAPVTILVHSHPISRQWQSFSLDEGVPQLRVALFGKRLVLDQRERLEVALRTEEGALTTILPRE